MTSDKPQMKLHAIDAISLYWSRSWTAWSLEKSGLDISLGLRAVCLGLGFGLERFVCISAKICVFGEMRYDFNDILPDAVCCQLRI